MKMLLLLALCALAPRAFCAEVEIKTTKDEVIRGTVVAANEKEVSVKTDFGVIRIPRETVANPEVLAGAPETPAEAQPVKGGGRLDEKAILAARRKVQRIDRLTPQENMDIAALIGKFGEALEFERAGLIEKLRAYCPKANETFRISYTRPEAIEVRTRLMPAIALRGNVGAIPIIEETHESVMTAFDEKIREEPDKQSWFDRGAQRVLTKKEIEKQAKAIAELAPELENNAAEV
ncbi:MAG: hypothetical protein KIS92_14715, partial [Planctomycetota bacterium]|nr:hypothetical protein [Planctomycetota bacterium]